MYCDFAAAEACNKKRTGQPMRSAAPHHDTGRRKFAIYLASCPHAQLKSIELETFADVEVCKLRIWLLAGIVDEVLHC